MVKTLTMHCRGILCAGFFVAPDLLLNGAHEVATGVCAVCRMWTLEQQRVCWQACHRVCFVRCQPCAMCVGHG
jgi:hypothetical protein